MLASFRWRHDVGREAKGGIRISASLEFQLLFWLRGVQTRIPSIRRSGYTRRARSGTLKCANQTAGFPKSDASPLAGTGKQLTGTGGTPELARGGGARDVLVADRQCAGRPSAFSVEGDATLGDLPMGARTDFFQGSVTPFAAVAVPSSLRAR